MKAPVRQKNSITLGRPQLRHGLQQRLIQNKKIIQIHERSVNGTQSVRFTVQKAVTFTDGESSSTADKEYEVPSKSIKGNLDFRVIQVQQGARLVVVSYVKDGSEAQLAGIRPGMVLTAISDPNRPGQVWEIPPTPKLGFVRQTILASNAATVVMLLEEVKWQVPSSGPQPLGLVGILEEAKQYDSDDEQKTDAQQSDTKQTDTQATETPDDVYPFSEGYDTTQLRELGEQLENLEVTGGTLDTLDLLLSDSDDEETFVQKVKPVDYDEKRGKILAKVVESQPRDQTEEQGGSQVAMPARGVEDAGDGFVYAPVPEGGEGSYIGGQPQQKQVEKKDEDGSPQYLLPKAIPINATGRLSQLLARSRGYTEVRQKRKAILRGDTGSTPEQRKENSNFLIITVCAILIPPVLILAIAQGTGYLDTLFVGFKY